MYTIRITLHLHACHALTRVSEADFAPLRVKGQSVRDTKVRGDNGTAILTCCGRTDNTRSLSLPVTPEYQPRGRAREGRGYVIAGDNVIAGDYVIVVRGAGVDV